MRIHILGSAAGGGVPQWNCNCANCRAARRNSSSFAKAMADKQSSVLSPRRLVRHSLGEGGSLRRSAGSPPFSRSRRTQSSIAISPDGKRWVLFNASPDLCAQFASSPPLAPSKGRPRNSPIEAVVLTDGEMDHVTGLLSLREQKILRLVCSHGVIELLTDQFRLLPTLQKYCKIEHRSFPVQVASLHISALDVSGKTPPYAKRAAKPGDVVGLRIERRGAKRTLAYLPCLPAITSEVQRFVEGCDCLLVDGTFWSEDEMTSPGLSKRSARDMGHVPISGKDGSLKWLEALKVKRRIYIHINNTNPVLRDGSRERLAVQRAGIEIAFDGMDIRL